jgi:hypothetical protein
MRIHPQTSGSRVVPRPAQASFTLQFSPEKLLNKKNWGFSPDFRNLTLLESINRLQDHLQNVPNYVAFMPNKPFRINASEHEKLSLRGCSSSH